MKYSVKFDEPTTIILINYRRIVAHDQPKIILDDKINVFIKKINSNFIINVSKEFINEIDLISHLYSFTLTPKYFIDINSEHHINHILEECVQVLCKHILAYPCTFVESPPNLTQGDCLVRVIGV